ncbi:MAG: cryptochrome/photolyase family protein [Pseudomonadota bacterium]
MLESALVWFRRDLRDYDHAALYHALKSARRVWCAFVFDSDILEALPGRSDRRVEFIRDSLAELHVALQAKGGGLMVRHGPAAAEIAALARQLGVAAVFANRDYEPRAKARDAAVAADLERDGIALHLFKDQAVFDGDEVLTKGGTPYTVFTPYKNCWLGKLEDFHVRPYPVDRYSGHLAPPPDGGGVPSLADIGFLPTDLERIGVVPGMSGGAARWQDFRQRLERYAEQRDFPAVKGVSYLSAYLRFGCLSIRQLAGEAWRSGGPGAATWLSELIWRDFYFMVLDRFPQLPDGCFKPEFDRVLWDEAPALLAAWREGRTGYPLVDAAMRQLAQTGWMHNRLRMVVASFLTKDLGLDWRLGEGHFADLLLDFDLAANNGGWQWAASTGCDAQPWFRIFNPITQSEKFDPQGRFIRRYVPELAGVPDKHIHAPWRMAPLEQQAAGVIIGRDYPAPVVDHNLARQRTLARFEAVKGKAGKEVAAE